MREPYPNELYHHGIKGMKWGVRRWQNEDGSLTSAGERHYYKKDGSLKRRGKKFLIKRYTKKVYHETRPTSNDPIQARAHDKSQAFKRKVEGGFAPSKKDFAKYTGPRDKTAFEKMREERQKNGAFYKQLSQQRKTSKLLKKDFSNSNSRIRTKIYDDIDKTIKEVYGKDFVGKKAQGVTNKDIINKVTEKMLGKRGNTKVNQWRDSAKTTQITLNDRLSDMINEVVNTRKYYQK